MGYVVAMETESPLPNCSRCNELEKQVTELASEVKRLSRKLESNNDGYLMIKHTQKAILNSRYSGTDRESGVSCPDFRKVATAFGFPAYQIRTWEDFERQIPLRQAELGPAICEVFMEPEQYFHPKLGVAVRTDGTLISPPLEDMSPFLPRELLQANLKVSMHPKSVGIIATCSRLRPVRFE